MEINCQELQQVLKQTPNDIFLLDVRERAEAEICQIEGSYLAPMSELAMQLNHHLDHFPQDQKIVIYCHHGVRSLKVLYFLLNNGFKADNLVSLKGGIDAWANQIEPSLQRY